MVTKEHVERRKSLNRAVYNDWGLYSFVQMLTYKCLLAGKTLELEDEHDTSKRCSCCGHLQEMPLYKRVYRCFNPDCLLVLDRDENSARNILQRFFCPAGATHPVRLDAVCCGRSVRRSGDGDRPS